MRVFAALFAWRDRTARTEDESIRYILPNHMLFKISDFMPTDISGLLSCCNPVPPLVKMNAPEILKVIADAKKEVCKVNNF